MPTLHQSEIILNHFSPWRFLVWAACFCVCAVLPSAWGQSPDCSDGSYSGIKTADLTLAGNVCLTGSLSMRGARLTIEAGTQISICASCTITIGSNSRAEMVAIGTPNAPIVFKAANPNEPWSRLLLNWPQAQQTVLEHAVIENAAGTSGALEIREGSGSDEGAFPRVDHVTIRNAGTRGLGVFASTSDPTPPSISNITITSSGAEAAYINNSAGASGLDGVWTLSGNGSDHIEVAGGVITVDTTFRDLGYPFFVTGSPAMRGARMTIEPGVRFLMCEGCSITIGSNAKGELVAIGTPEDPIVFSAADPGKPWRRLLLNWPQGRNSILQHAIIENAAGVDGALEVREGSGSDTGPFPVIDQVAIRNAGTRGLGVFPVSTDPTPPSITNMTITGSGAEAVRLSNAAGVSGLDGSWTLSGNGADQIEIGGGNVSIDLTFRNLGHPFAILASVNVRDIDQAGEPTRVVIDEGVDMRIAEDQDINIGTLFNANVTLAVNGTPEAPVRFSRLDPAGGPWGALVFGQDLDAAADSTVQHAIFDTGGGLVSTSEQTAAIAHIGYGRVSLDQVEVRGSLNTGVYVASAGSLSVTNSRIENNAIGLAAGSPAIIRNSTFQNNLNGGIVNLNPKDVCVDAIGNFWGDASGPLDESSQVDACFASATNVGSGDGVSDGVLYRPSLGQDAGELADLSGISIEPFWVVADGVDRGTVTITVRDAAGNPLPGKLVRLDSTLGDVIQPAGPTNAAGQVAASVSSESEGIATLTARNLTDGVDLGAIAGVTFWSGGGETAGLIQPGGVPYLAPQLRLEGAPFEQGFPMVFKFPMRNGNTSPVDVALTYRVSNFGVGSGFGEVGTVSKTLQPGDEWDGELVWFPPSTGHRCVQVSAVVEGVDVASGVAQSAGRATVNIGPYQVNFDVPEDPCQKLDVNKLVPGGRPGVPAVVKHFSNALIQAYLIRQCLSQDVTFGPSAVLVAERSQREADRDYQTLVAPRVFTPPQLGVGNGVDQAEATAANAAVNAFLELAALDEAIQETKRRVRAAGQAGADGAALRQEAALRGFQLDYADRLDAASAAIAEFLAVTKDQGEPDTVFDASGIETYLAELAVSGYDQETVGFLESTGLSAAEIADLADREIAAFADSGSLVTTSFYQFLGLIRNAADRQARKLRSTYDPPRFARAAEDLGGVERNSPSTLAGIPVALDTADVRFEVGHSFDTTRTVQLVVKAVELPIGWTYALSRSSFSLDPGETSEATLFIEADSPLAEAGRARIAVEGYVGSELVGGIMVEKSFPGSRIFSDRFQLVP